MYDMPYGLTDNYRYVTLKKYFGNDRVILQVEDVIEIAEDQGYGLLPASRVVWRDTTPADMTKLNLKLAA